MMEMRLSPAASVTAGAEILVLANRDYGVPLAASLFPRAAMCRRTLALRCAHPRAHVHKALCVSVS